MGGLLVLGAGYIGAAVAARALADGLEVTLADNWSATDEAQVSPLAADGARVVTADIRFPHDVDMLLADGPDRIVLLAAQASRPLSFEDPEYTEQTNCTGVRHVAEAVGSAGGPPVVFGSSLHVYGSGLSGAVGADRPYGDQGDLAHLSKVYGELVLKMHAARGGFDLSLLRLGIVYGPSPVQHGRPESVTVVDKFRRLAAAGEPLTLDDGGRATIGVVHVDDVARIVLEAPAGPANVAAETISVGDVAALAEGREPSGEAAWTVESPFSYRHSVAGYLRG
ncbi:MAG: NAD-dependent epimerase/dehydratase family protein [Actinomycetota bacterium]|nr:NAD-dependent epimerase/dehydratase family protein [Actinomycetota bacterium]